MSEAAAAPGPASDAPAAAVEAPPGDAPGATDGGAAAPAPAEGVKPDVPAEPKPEPEHKLATRNVELTQKLREVTARAAELEKSAGAVERLKSMVANNDFESFLAEFGTSYKAITDYYAGQEDDSPLGKEVADLKKWRADREKEQEARAAAETRAMHVHNAERVLKAEAEKYKLCARRGDRPLPDGKTVAETAVEAVAYAWKADGSPTIDDAGYHQYLASAFDRINAWLDDERKSMADPVAPAPVVAAAAPAAAAPARAGSAREAVRAVAAEASQTLTRDSVSGPVGGAPAPRSKSAREAAAEWAAEHGA